MVLLSLNFLYSLDMFYFVTFANKPKHWGYVPFFI